MKPFNEKIYVTRPILPDLDKVREEMEDIWETGMLTNFSDKHNELESKVKNYLKVDHLALFNNGTTALMIAIKALDIKGEVIVTPFTFPATLHALDWNNLKPVFCDVEKDSLNIDPERIEGLINDKTSAILAVHIFGNPCDHEKISRIAKKYDLRVIYDAAHAFGVEVDGKSIGNLGDVSMFSFHATKLFHTIEGGAVTTQDKSLAKKVKILRNFGIDEPEKIVMPGINGKLNELQSVVGLVNFELLSKEIKRRKEIHGLYCDYLKGVDGVDIYSINANVKKNYQYFVIRINEKMFGRSRKDVLEVFTKYNVFPSKYFFPICSEFKHYKKEKSAKRKYLLNSYNASMEVLALPFYGKLKNEEVKKICDILKSVKK